MHFIDFQEMKDIQIRGAATIINVLPAEYFEKTHIPGSINIPFDSDDFPDRVKAVISETDTPIVVYCANASCEKSRKAGKALVDAGFSNVMCFKGGTQEWQDKTAVFSAAS